MNPPQLPIAPSRKIATRMHGENIIAAQYIPLLPSVVVGHATAMQQLREPCADPVALHGLAAIDGYRRLLDPRPGLRGRLGGRYLGAWFEEAKRVKPVSLGEELMDVNI